jgi:NAD-dependent DNA ligase
VEDTIHIKPMGDDVAVESACIQLTHALGELGAENVGPGMVEKLYAAGFTTLRKIYDATVADIATTVEGCKTKMAERIYDGLRVKQSTWTELNLMVASCTMPRGVGHTKLTPLLKLKPDPATWVAALDVLKKARPTGLSENTIVSIVDAIPSYIAWKTAAGPGFTIQPSPSSTSSPSTSTPMIVVFTGIRDKELEAALEARGHIIGSSITKKTTHVVSAATDSAKLTKAKEMGIIILSPSQCRANLTMQ